MRWFYYAFIETPDGKMNEAWTSNYTSSETISLTPNRRKTICQIACGK